MHPIKYATSKTTAARAVSFDFENKNKIDSYLARVGYT